MYPFFAHRGPKLRTIDDRTIRSHFKWVPILVIEQEFMVENRDGMLKEVRAERAIVPSLHNLYVRR